MSSLSNGIPMPKPLNLDNIAANWKKFRKASWDNYAVVVRLQRFDEEYKLDSDVSFCDRRRSAFNLHGRDI